MAAGRYLSGGVSGRSAAAAAAAATAAESLRARWRFRRVRRTIAAFLGGRLAPRALAFPSRASRMQAAFLDGRIYRASRVGFLLHRQRQHQINGAIFRFPKHGRILYVLR